MRAQARYIMFRKEPEIKIVSLQINIFLKNLCVRQKFELIQFLAYDMIGYLQGRGPFKIDFLLKGCQRKGLGEAKLH